MSYRRIALIAMFSVSAALIGPGCGGKKKSGDKSTFKYLPKDSDFVMGINGEEARGKVKRYASYVPGKVGKLVKSLRSCGVDIVRSTQSATIGSNSATMRGVVVLKGFTKTDFKQCGEVAQEVRVEQTDSETSISMSGVTMNMAWIDDTTFVGGPGFEKAEVAPLALGQGGADNNDTLTSLLGEVNQKAAIWFVFAPEDTGSLPGGDMIGEMSAAYGSVDLASGVKITLGVKMKKGDDAKGLASLLKSALPQFKEQAGGLGKFLDRLEVSSSGKNVKVQLALSDAELKEIESIAKNDPKIAELRAMLSGE